MTGLSFKVTFENKNKKTTPPPQKKKKSKNQNSKSIRGPKTKKRNALSSINFRGSFTPFAACYLPGNNKYLSPQLSLPIAHGILGSSSDTGVSRWLSAPHRPPSLLVTAPDVQLGICSWPGLSHKVWVELHSKPDQSEAHIQGSQGLVHRWARDGT